MLGAVDLKAGNRPEGAGIAVGDGEGRLAAYGRVRPNVRYTRDAAKVAWRWRLEFPANTKGKEPHCSVTLESSVVTGPRVGSRVSRGGALHREVRRFVT